MKYLYFGYGMNTNLHSMQSRCSEATVLGPAELLHHELEFAHHCNVKRRTDSRVLGLLWQVSDQDLANLDILEGYPYYYTREGTAVEYCGQQHLAIVYSMTGRTEPSPPSEGYWNLVQQGYQENKISQTQLIRALNNSYEPSTV